MMMFEVMLNKIKTTQCHVITPNWLRPGIEPIKSVTDGRTHGQTNIKLTLCRKPEKW